MELVLIWMTGAFLVGQLFRIISLPSLVGFILSGYIFTMLGISDDIGLLSMPAEIGVELLLFSIGLKIKPSAFLNRYLLIFQKKELLVLRRSHTQIQCYVRIVKMQF